MPVVDDCEEPNVKAGAGAGFSDGASNEGIDGLGEPKVGVAPILGEPNMGICGVGLLAGCGEPNMFPDGGF